MDNTHTEVCDWDKAGAPRIRTGDSINQGLGLGIWDSGLTIRDSGFWWGAGSFAPKEQGIRSAAPENLATCCRQDLVFIFSFLNHPETVIGESSILEFREQINSSTLYHCIKLIKAVYKVVCKKW